MRMIRVRGEPAGVAIVAFCLACIGGTVSLATAGDSSRATAQSTARVADLLGPADWGANLTGPLCGVYAACAALELIGIEADPRDFVAAKYVGRCGGSSPEEVARVVQESGARARILSRLSAFDLRLMDCPLIANVRISPASNRFNHWVVAVPSRRGVTIFDGLQDPYQVRTAEFLGIWSGIGICVTKADASPLASVWLGRSALLPSVLMAVALVLRNRRSLAGADRAGIFKQCCGLCAASLALGLATNAAFGDLLHHRQGVAAATAGSQAGKYRTGTLDDARKAAASRHILLVDARREADFQLGTIPGAVNIPVTASIWEMNKYLEKLDRRTPIVVFCQSASCGYDETVGAELASLGFNDVTVCNEGWLEFQKSPDRIMSR